MRTVTTLKNWNKQYSMRWKVLKDSGLVPTDSVHNHTTQGVTPTGYIHLNKATYEALMPKVTQEKLDTYFEELMTQENQTIGRVKEVYIECENLQFCAIGLYTSYSAEKPMELKFKRCYKEFPYTVYNTKQAQFESPMSVEMYEFKRDNEVAFVLMGEDILSAYGL